MSIDSTNHQPPFGKAAVARAFNRAVDTYDRSAVLHNIVGERLFERLDLVKIEPEKILDVGCGTGHFSRQLQQRYKKKQVLGIDLAWKMSAFAKGQRNWFAKERFICADAEALPLPDNSVDLIFSNLMLQWITNPDHLFQEMQRVLVPGGLLMFTGFGPDTLKEMRHSWASVDENVHVNVFSDMHDIGDSLSNSGFAGIVMDNETITMTYDSLSELHQDLHNLGEANINSERNHGLTPKGHWQRYLQEYEQFRDSKGKYLASWEINYGHAWATQSMPARKIDTDTGVYPVTISEYPD